MTHSDTVGYDDSNSPIFRHVDDPGVWWVGTGGYWHHAYLSDVELTEKV